MSKIFISYRREDTDIGVGRLADDLRKHFPSEDIFQDIASIDPGADFPVVLNEALATAAAMLVVIGPRWLSATDRQGRKRLENPGDFVRLEVAESLGRPGVRVFPLLVGGAEMPAEQDLPDVLKPLARRHAHELTARYWARDVAELVQILKRVPSIRERQAATGAGALPTANTRERLDQAEAARQEKEAAERQAAGIAAQQAKEAAEQRRREEAAEAAERARVEAADQKVREAELAARAKRTAQATMRAPEKPPVRPGPWPKLVGVAIVVAGIAGVFMYQVGSPGTELEFAL